MWKIKLSTQYKKDFKRYLNKPKKLRELDKVIMSLSETGTVPAECKPHPLAGEWSGYIECHIESDFLLIWYDKEAGVIKLTRLGTHAELFKE